MQICSAIPCGITLPTTTICMGISGMMITCSSSAATSRTNPSDIDSGGRALEAVVRPYPMAVPGTRCFYILISNPAGSSIDTRPTQPFKLPRSYSYRNFNMRKRAVVENTLVELDLENQRLSNSPSNAGEAVNSNQKKSIIILGGEFGIRLIRSESHGSFTGR